MRIHVTGPERSDGVECERILRALPEWFGIEEALVQYVKDIRVRDTFLAHLDGCVVGFLTVTRHNDVSAEIHVMGVLPDEHRSGIGRAW